MGINSKFLKKAMSAAIFSAVLINSGAVASAQDNPVQKAIPFEEGTPSRIIYDGLKTLIENVAAGKEATSVGTFTFDYTYDELGVGSLPTVEEFKAAVKTKTDDYNAEAVVDRLKADYPYHFYWHGGMCTYSDVSSGDSFIIQDNATTSATVTYKVSFDVNADYAAQGEYAADKTKTAAAASIMENAQAIVNENKGKSDIERLKAYKDKICELVDFDSTGDASREIINVFDTDSNTNATGYGYAKAFQYLCDLDGGLTCYSVMGASSGGVSGGMHMWNIVTLNGANYLVDVTNCDTGTVGAGEELFLKGMTSMNSGNTYYRNVNNKSVVYTYEETMSSLFGADTLKLSASNYVSAHKATYTVDGATISTACSICGAEETKGTASIHVSGGTYNGSPFLATVSQTGVLANINIPVTYSVKGGEKLQNAPVDAGEYTASITLGEGENIVTASADYTIAKKIVSSVASPEATAITYGNKLSDSTLTNGWKWENETILPVPSGKYKAYIEVDDSNYDYSQVEGYNSANHRVEREIALQVNKATVTITAKSYSIKLGEALPVYEYDVAGLVNGEKLPINVTISCEADGKTAGCFGISVVGDRESANYTYRYISGTLIISDLEPVSSPVFNPPNGTVFESAHDITISCATDGAKIYYQLQDPNGDGEAKLYEGPITIKKTITIAAVAVKDGMADSPIVRASYVVEAEEVEEEEDEDEKLINFVDRLYTILLDRHAEQNGLEDWTNRLKSGTATSAEIVYGIAGSPEFNNKGLSNEDVVERLYQAMLGRASDASGKADWVNKLNTGMSINAIINGFSGSEEFGNICAEFGIQAGAVSNLDARDKNFGLTSFVSRMYTKALGRTYDVDGLNDWTNRYLTGTAKIGDIAYGFIFSQEFINKNLDNSDYLDTLYRTFFDREADEGGKSDWMNKLSSGMAREDVLNGFVDSQECINLVNSFNI